MVRKCFVTICCPPQLLLCCQYAAFVIFTMLLYLGCYRLVVLFSTMYLLLALVFQWGCHVPGPGARCKLPHVSSTGYRVPGTEYRVAQMTSQHNVGTHVELQSIEYNVTVLTNKSSGTRVDCGNHDDAGVCGGACATPPPVTSARGF